MALEPVTSVRTVPVVQTGRAQEPRTDQFVTAMPHKPIPERLKGSITNEERVRWGTMTSEVFRELPPDDEKSRGRYVRSVIRAESLSKQRKMRVQRDHDADFDALGIEDPTGFWRMVFKAVGGMQALARWVKENPLRCHDQFLSPVLEKRRNNQDKDGLCPRCREEVEGLDKELKRLREYMEQERENEKSSLAHPDGSGLNSNGRPNSDDFEIL